MKNPPIISLLMPTRKRLERVNTFLKSVVSTASDLTRIEVIIAIDEDDSISTQITSPHPNLHIVKTIAPRTTMGGLNTRCHENASGSILMLVNDDIQIRTKNWDTHIIEGDQQFPDKIYLMHTKDGFKDRAFPIFPILSKRCAKLLIDPYPKDYCGDGNDTHLHDLFLRLKDLGEDRFIYLENVFFEHLHHGLGKAPVDSTYKSRSHTSGSRTFHSLWKERDCKAHALFQMINTEKKPPPSLCTNLIGSFFFSRASFKYRFKTLCYHFAREVYLRLKLHRLKSKMKKLDV